MILLIKILEGSPPKRQYHGYVIGLSRSFVWESLEYKLKIKMKIHTRKCVCIILCNAFILSDNSA